MPRRVHEPISRSKIAAEAPAWRGAARTGAARTRRTQAPEAQPQRSHGGWIGREHERDLGSRALTRRDLFRLVGGAAVLAKLPACGDNAGDRVFTSAELTMLYDLANVIIPPDDTPGGAELGAIAFIEALVTAYDHDPPMIYAGGPFSDRAGASDDGFANFIELDRVSDAAWRLDTASIKQQLVAGLAAARALGISDPAKLYDALDADFQALLFELVTEAAWAAPEYGGNPNLAGWAMIHFEGDSLPMGYSQWNGSGYDERGDAPMSTPNPSDPEPLTDDVRQVIMEVVAVLGGQTFP